MEFKQEPMDESLGQDDKLSIENQKCYNNNRIITKFLIPLEMNICRNKCHEKISIDEQKKILDNYLKINTQQERRTYITQLIKPRPSNMDKYFILNLNPHQMCKKYNMFDYYIKIDTGYVRVCKECFMICFDETKSFMKLVLEKICPGYLSFPNEKKQCVKYVFFR